MTTMRSFIRRHPMPAYYLLTFALSWGGTLLVIGGLGNIPGSPDDITRLFPLVYLTTVIGPGLAGALLTALIGGRAGLGELRSRLLRWRVGARWYGVALLIAPLSVMAILLALSFFSPEFFPGILRKSDDASLPGLLTLPFGVVAGLAILTGFLEELGWTGFAIPRMLPRYGVPATGLVVGFLWGAWHFASNVWASSPTAGTPPLALFLAVLLFSFLPPYRMLMVWVYDHTRSLLVAMLMHASLVLFWLLATPPGIAGMPLVTWYVAWAALLWAVVAVVAVASRGSLMQGQETQMAIPQAVGRGVSR